MITLNRRARYLARVSDRVHTRLARGTEIEPILQQLAQQLPPLPLEHHLKLPVLKLIRLDTRKLLNDLLQLGARPIKPISPAPLDRAVRCAGIAAAPRLQDFIGRRVKFAGTGAGVGDHEATSRWSALM